jgi:tetratricopeptide (TPR) repeat protein/CHAT domain-containing protein
VGAGRGRAVGEGRRLSVPLPGLILACLFCLPPRASIGAELAPELKAVMDQYFAAYARKDMEAALALWSARSPELAARRDAFQKLFAGYEKIEVRSVTMRQASVTGERARLRFLVEIQYSGGKLGQPPPPPDQLDRVMRCVLEAGQWKIWAYRPSEEDLALSLTEAGTPAEQQTLLSADSDLVSPDLVQAVLDRGLEAQNHGQYARATSIYELGQEIAARINDSAGRARALEGMGAVEYLQGRYPQAVEHFRESLAICEERKDELKIANCLNNIAVVQTAQGGYREALAAYRQSLQIYEKRGSKSLAAGTLNNIGNIYHDQGRSAEAIQTFEESLTLARASGDRSAISAALNNMGIVHADQGDYRRALELYQQSQELNRALDDRRSIAITLNNIGNARREQADYDEALVCYRQSRELFEALGDADGSARILTNLGLVYQERGEYGKALEYHQESLKRLDQLGERPAVARAQGNLGNCYEGMGDYRAALAWHRKGLELSQTLGNQWGVAAALGNIAIVFSDQGDYPQALETFRQSLELKRAIGDRSGQAQTLNNIGNVLKEQGDTSQALSYLEKALAMKQALGEKNAVAQALNNIALVHEQRGDYALALAYHLRSLTVAERLGDLQGRIRSLCNIGNISMHQGNLAQAGERYGRALKLAEAAGNRKWMAVLLNNLGLVHESRGEYAEALGFLQRSRELREAMGDRAGVALASNNIGHTYLSQRKYAAALQACRESLKLSQALGERPSVARSWLNIGDITRRQGHAAEALAAYRQGLALAETVRSPAIAFGCLSGIGDAERARGQPAAALAAYRRAVQINEEARSRVGGGEEEQERFFENKVAPYHGSVELLVAQHRAPEALAVAERARARVLLDVLRRGPIDISRSMTRQEQEREKLLRAELVSLGTQIRRESGRPRPDTARLASLNARLQAARRDYEAFQTALYTAHPELKTQRGEMRPLLLREAAGLLPDARTALLEYVVTEKQRLLFVMTRAVAGSGRAIDLKVYPVPTGPEPLAEEVERFRLQLSRPDLVYEPLALRLYNRLLRPARRQLQGRTTWIIVPDGPLWELPFQALQPRRNHFLVEDAALSYVPSLTVLRELTARHREAGGRSTASAVERTSRPRTGAVSSPTLLAIGNPALGPRTRKLVQLAQRGESLVPLPAAEAEVRRLAQVYGRRESRVLVGAAAREEQVKAELGLCRRLHFATHGFLDSKNPMYSHILLSQGGGGSEDGLLEAWELLQLPLKADLVVLSACETARGRVSAGEGVIGLSWALFVAGCPRTVVSQWKVADASTARLMVAFHRHLQARGTRRDRGSPARMATAQALRQAALGLRRQRQTAHPYYWAPFVLVGDGS